jgi:toluene monooxygenase system ferredoxin subunit
VTFVKAASRDDLWDGEMRAVTVAGARVLLVNVGGEVSAFADRCAHQGVALSEGRLEAGTIVCSAHGWTYDARSGCGLNPSSACLARFAVRTEGDAIFVDVGDGGDRAGRRTRATSARPDAADRVGPVLVAGPLADAVVGAIREAHADVEIDERGSYLRVGVPGRCLVTREALVRHAGADFALPRDLEAIMPSFRGRFRVTDDRAEWALDGDLP